MKRIIIFFVLMIYLLSLAGCATTSSTGEKTAVGAGLGALAGGAIGFLSTGKASGALTGAAIGAAVGGISGYVIGKYEEEKLKTAEQIYKEKPYLKSKKARNDPPQITDFEPAVFDMNDKEITDVKSGDNIKLGMKYQIEIPEQSKTKTVKVIERDYLIDADGKQWMDGEDTTRKMERGTEQIRAKIPVRTDGLPAGKYTHVSIVKLGNQEKKEQQLIQVVKLNNEIKIYALNNK